MVLKFAFCLLHQFPLIQKSENGSGRKKTKKTATPNGKPQTKIIFANL
jgi:hypothetical protein